MRKIKALRIIKCDIPIFLCMAIIILNKSIEIKSQVSDLCLMDKEIRYINKDNIRSLSNEDSLIAEFWEENNLERRDFSYLFWNTNMKVLIPEKCNNLNQHQVDIFNRKFESQMEYNEFCTNEMLLITSREMMLYRLIQVKRDFKSYIYAIDSLHHPKDLPILDKVRFHMFEFISHDSIRCKYLTYNPTNTSELINQRYWLRLNPNDIYEELKNVKKEPKKFPINISIQGYLEDCPIGNYDFSFQCGSIDNPIPDNIGINSHLIEGGKKVRINLKSLVGLDNIEKLRCHRISFKQSSSQNSIFINTCVYKDLLNKSTVERTPNDTTFVLTYFKTINFVPMDSVGNHFINNEIKNIKNFLINYYSRYHRVNNFEKTKLYLEFTGYADRKGKKIWGDTRWISKNSRLAYARAKRIQEQLVDLITKSDHQIPIEIFKVRHCDESYFNGNNRSVEIIAWIQR